MKKRPEPQAITTLPASPRDERRTRMIKYSIAMGIRTLCVAALLFVHGWWALLLIAAALVLPYLAVVIANVGARPEAVDTVERPGAIVPVRAIPVFPPDDVAPGDRTDRAS